jgi:hypothetical protein
VWRNRSSGHLGHAADRLHLRRCHSWRRRLLLLPLPVNRACGGAAAGLALRYRSKVANHRATSAMRRPALDEAGGEGGGSDLDRSRGLRRDAIAVGPAAHASLAQSFPSQLVLIADVSLVEETTAVRNYWCFFISPRNRTQEADGSIPFSSSAPRTTPPSMPVRPPCALKGARAAAKRRQA